MRLGEISTDNIRDLAGTAPTNGQVLTYNGSKIVWGSGGSGYQGYQGNNGTNGNQGNQGNQGNGVQGYQGVQGAAGGGGGVAQYPVNLTFISLNSVVSTWVKLYKTAGSTIPTHDPDNGIAEWDYRQCDPYVSNGGTIRSISVNFSSTYVSGATKDAQVYVRAYIYKIRLSGSGGPILLTGGSLDIPLTTTPIHIYNNQSALSTECSGTLNTSISTSAGDLIGCVIDVSNRVGSGLSATGYVNGAYGVVASINIY